MSATAALILDRLAAAGLADPFTAPARQLVPLPCSARAHIDRGEAALVVAQEPPYGWSIVLAAQDWQRRVFTPLPRGHATRNRAVEILAMFQALLEPAVFFPETPGELEVGDV